MNEVIAALLGPIVALVVLGYAYLTYREIRSLPDGTDKMREISSAIHEGVMVLVRRE